MAAVKDDIYLGKETDEGIEKGKGIPKSWFMSFLQSLIHVLDAREEDSEEKKMKNIFNVGNTRRKSSDRPRKNSVLPNPPSLQEVAFLEKLVAGEYDGLKKESFDDPLDQSYFEKYASMPSKSRVNILKDFWKQLKEFAEQGAQYRPAL